MSQRKDLTKMTVNELSAYLRTTPIDSWTVRHSVAYLRMKHLMALGSAGGLPSPTTATPMTSTAGGDE